MSARITETKCLTKCDLKKYISDQLNQNLKSWTFSKKKNEQKTVYGPQCHGSLLLTDAQTCS